MIEANDLNKGVVFEYDGNIWMVVWFQHHKPGKGGAMMRVKLKNMKTGSIIDRTFKSGEKFQTVDLSRRRAQFTYESGSEVHFMDAQSFEDIVVQKDQIEDSLGFLMENLEVDALYLDGAFLGIELPASVQLSVTETVPGVKGDTATNVMKPAKLETGIEIQVPGFIKEGDKVKVDTRSKAYIERV